MRQGPLSDKLDQIKNDLQKSSSHFHRSMEGLRVVREVVQELRDGGLDVSLEARADGHGSPVQDVSDAVVNGTLTMEGAEVEFLFRKEGYNSYQYFTAYAGNTQIENLRFRSDEADRLKNTVTRMLLKVKAQNELLEEFNVNANGATRATKLDKSVLPKPPKLKSGP